MKVEAPSRTAARPRADRIPERELVESAEDLYAALLADADEAAAEAFDLLPAYVDGALDSEEAERFASGLPDRPALAGARRDLAELAAELAERPTGRLLSWRLRSPVAARRLALAASLLLAVAGAWLLREWPFEARPAVLARGPESPSTAPSPAATPQPVFVSDFDDGVEAGWVPSVQKGKTGPIFTGDFDERELRGWTVVGGDQVR